MTNSPQPKSWRDVLPIHPAAELFPAMSESEILDLGKDIKKNGLRYPIILWRENEGAKAYLLDGRNRLDAMESVGAPTVDEHGELLHWSFRDGDPYDLVLSFNLHRRHLTADQRHELIAKILKAKPTASNVTIAKQAKVNDKTVAKVRAGLERRSEIPNVEVRTDTRGRKQPAHKETARLRQRAWKLYGAGKSQVDIAAELGVAQSTVSKYLRGESRSPRPEKPAASAEVSTEQRSAEMAQLATAPDDLVDQAIRLVEQMTADQRQDFLARFWKKKLPIGNPAADKAAVDNLFSEFFSEIFGAPTNGAGRP